MKQFYFCTDCTLTTPQPEQHALGRNMASLLSGQIVFYGSEEITVSHVQPFILQKLYKMSNLDGVLFFSFDQFCYGEGVNFKLLANIIKLKLSIHFVRENLSLYSLVEISEQFLLLSAYKHSVRHRIGPKNSM